jgi:xylulokinase
MPDTLLVFDFGTTYFKAGVVDRTGNLVALHRQPSPIVSPAPGRSEIPIDAFRKAVTEACAALPLGDVRAISSSSQANTFTLLDGKDQPIAPLIVWNDARANDLGYCPEFTDLADERPYLEAAGLPTITHEFTPAKLVHLRNDTPLRVAFARRVIWLPDLFMHDLTGVFVTEGSIAALSGLFDVPNWAWMKYVIGGLGYGVEMLSPVVRAGTDIGEVLPAVADALGLPRGCRVIAGCLDQYAGALGVGNNRPGLLSETTGTVQAVVACSSQWNAGDGIFRGPGSDPGQFFHMSFGDVSANLLEHYRNLLPDRPSYEAISAAMSDTDRLRLDPAVGTESLKRTITGWATTESRGDVVRAIFRAVAESLAGHVSKLTDRPTEIRSAGGAAKSREWLQLKADVLGIPVIAPATEEPTLLGAASLPAKTLGWAPLSTIDAPPDPSRVFRPL